MHITYNIALIFSLASITTAFNTCETSEDEDIEFDRQYIIAVKDLPDECKENYEEEPSDV